MRDFQVRPSVYRRAGFSQLLQGILLQAAPFCFHNSSFAHDPFKTRIDIVLPRREASPYAGRIRLVWQQMRGPVIERFPASPGRPDLESMLLAQRKDFWQLVDRTHKEGEKKGFTKLENLPG